MTTVSTKVDDDTRQQLLDLAQREDRTLAQILRIALKEYIEKHNNNQKEK